MIRLNKFIAESGIASRRGADEIIAQGRVVVNGAPVVSAGLKIDPDKDEILVDGERIKSESKVYFLLNKPAGTISSTKDERNRRTVTSLIKTNKNIFPVGRLDFNTTGVLLLTNDGDFSNFLLHPKNKFRREYSVLLDKELPPEQEASLKKGVFIDGKKGRFKSIKFPKSGNRKSVIVTAEEGRNHFVKNMFYHFGINVKRLERISFGPFNTQGLARGEYIELESEAIKIFMNKKNN